jgi:hypothetical protein
MPEKIRYPIGARIRRPLHVVLVVLSSGGCIVHLGDDESAIGHITRDCVVPVPDGVSALAAPVSLEYPTGSLWIWEELELANGGTVEGASAFVESAEAVCAAGPTLAVETSGVPASLLALTGEERAANERRRDGRRLILAPRGGFVEGTTGYLFYEHVLRGPEVFDEAVIGTGLCVLPEGASSCERVGLPDATVLFHPTERSLNGGGMVAGDRAFVYGCHRVAELRAVCTVSSAPLDQLTEPQRYQVHSQLSGWRDELTEASSLVDELGTITVVPYGDEFLMTTLDIFEARVYVRRAGSPVGPFGRRTTAFSVLPSSFFPGGGREHAGLRRAPDELNLSYTTDNAQAPGLHLVTFRTFGALGQ